MYVAISKGGRSSFYKTNMKSTAMSWIESLLPWNFMAGDNIHNEHLLTLFMGYFNSESNSYKFFLSP